MSQQWITPAGSLANLLIGVPVSVQLEAFDTTNSGATAIWSLSGQDTLPPGLTLSSSGIISGTPEYSSPSNNYFTTINYNFTVRLTSSDNTQAIDENGLVQPYRTFTIIITNVINQDFNWVTSSGNLGTVPNGEYYSLPIKAETTGNANITYSFLSGELPSGMQVLKTGYLQGVPTFVNPVAVDQNQTYRFTIRATTNTGHVNDRSFSLTVTNIYGPVITPNSPLEFIYDPITNSDVVTNYPPGVVVLGAAFDGDYYSQQLTVFELNPNVKIQWSIKSGSLPLGVTLSQNGLLSGYIQPLQLVNGNGPPGYDGDTVVNNIIVEEEQFDSAPYDFGEVNQSLHYNFTVQAFDGANYTLQNYILEVISRNDFSADTTLLLNDTYITIDSGNIFLPVITTTTTTLPTARQDSYYAFKFNAVDFSNAQLTYSIVNNVGAFDAFVSGVDAGFDYNGDNISHLAGVGFDSFTQSQNTFSTGNLPGLILDPTTGWLYGKVLPQTLSIQNFEFAVQASKTVGGVTYNSVPKFVVLPVAGKINNTIQWITPSDLGSINNGSVSELSIVANSEEGEDLVYSIYDRPGVPVRLPQGLQLLPTGEISGRVSFETFSIDQFTTTFDNDLLTVDKIYKFTVLVKAVDGTAESIKEFSIRVNIVDQIPYVDLYLQALPSYHQRQIFDSIVNDTTIFDPSLIYRSNDPWFGVNQNINMLFLPGLNSASLNEYQNAISLNHWNKTYNLGEVKTASVLDNNYSVKYEVVYIEVIDPEETFDHKSPGLEIDLQGTISNPYIDAKGNEFFTVYPNTTTNMINRLVSGIGYQNQSTLPPWMSSNQPGVTANTFNTPLGYTRAIVLAYTIPGASKQIAYRLNKQGIDFRNIDFRIDRYFVDNYYSDNFQGNTWVLGKETTFDSLQKNNIGIIVAKVDYAVSVPFNQINGRTVDYVNSRGGFDGITTFKNGESVIFTQQENFVDAGPYDGWISYSDAFLGDNIATTTIEGYDSESFDTYEIIPGFLEAAANPNLINKRGGTWIINVVNGVINLISSQQILLNQRVQIVNGKNFREAIFYYNSILPAGYTVPYYKIFRTGAATTIILKTTFNAGTTKFFSNRDHYYTPGSNDQILKFPQDITFS